VNDGNTPDTLERNLGCGWFESKISPIVRKIDRQTKVMALFCDNFPLSLTTLWQDSAILYFVPSPNIYTPGQEDLLAADYKAALSSLSEKFKKIEPRSHREGNWEKNPNITGWWRKDFYYGGQVEKSRFAELSYFPLSYVKRYMSPKQGAPLLQSDEWVIGLVLYEEIDPEKLVLLNYEEVYGNNNGWQTLVFYGRSLDTAVKALRAAGSWAATK